MFLTGETEKLDRLALQMDISKYAWLRRWRKVVLYHTGNPPMAGRLGEHDDADCCEEREHDYLAEVSGLALGIGEVHL